VLLPAAVAQLPPESRQLLRLWKDEGLSFEEIGPVTAQAPSTIRACWKCLLRQLQENL
jgi:hypothetical protein